MSNEVNDYNINNDTDDYVCIFKDIDNILDDLDYNKEDRMLCRSIIDSLEKEAAKQLSDKKCIQLPFIGNMRKHKIREALVSHYKDFKEARKTMTKEEYNQYAKKILKQEKQRIKEEERQIKNKNKVKSVNYKIWLSKFRKFGKHYANFWLYSVSKWTVVEFDPDVELAYREIMEESYGQ